MSDEKRSPAWSNLAEPDISEVDTTPAPPDDKQAPKTEKTVGGIGFGSVARPARRGSSGW